MKLSTYDFVIVTVLVASSMRGTCRSTAASPPGQETLPAAAIARLGATRFVHRDRIDNLAFLPDGSSLFAVAGSEAAIWNLATGRKRQTLGLERSIMCGALSQNGRTAVLAENGRRLYVFDTSTGQQLAQLEGLASRCHDVVITPDGQRVAGAARDLIGLWNVADGKLLRQWKAGGEYVKSLELSPNGKRLVIAVQDVPMRVHRLDGDDPPVQLEGGAGFRAWAAFSPDGKTIAGSCEVAFSRGRRSSLRFWDSATGTVTRNIPGSYRAGTFSPDGEWLAACDLRGVVLYDAATGAEIRRLPDCNEHLWAAAFSPDGKTLAVGQAQRIRLWNTDTWREVHPTTGHSEQLQTVVFAPDGQSIATGGLDGRIILWSWPEAKELRRIDGIGSHWGVRHLTFSPNGKTLAATAWINWDDTFFLFDTATGKPISRFGKDDQGKSPVAFLPDSRVALTGQMDGSMALWDVASGKKIRAVGKHLGHIQQVSPLPNFETAWWADESQRFGLRDLTTGEDQRVFAGASSHSIGRLAVSPDGEWLAVGSRVCDAKTGKEIVKGRDTPVAISPDGRLLAFGKNNGIVVWEALTRQEIHTLDAGEVNAVAFSPDGTTLASAGYADALVWDMTGRLKEGRLPPITLSPAELEAQWETMGGEDAWAAHQAAWTFAAGGETAIAFLSDHLRPARIPDPPRIQALRRQLANADRDVRVHAARMLLDLGVELRPEDHEALNRPDPPIVKSPFRELSGIYSGLPRPQPPPVLLPLPDRLRASRAVAALERSRVPDAESLLDSLADGAPQVPLTREAIGALERVQQKR